MKGVFVLNLQSGSLTNEPPQSPKKEKDFKKWIGPSIILLIFLILLLTKSYDLFQSIGAASLFGLLAYGIYSLFTLKKKIPYRKKVFSYLGIVLGLSLIGGMSTEDPRIQIQAEYDAKLKEQIELTKQEAKKACETENAEITKKNEELTKQSKELETKLTAADKKYKEIEEEKKKLEEKVAQLDKEKSDLLAQNEKLKSAPVATNTPAKSNNTSSGGGSSGGSSNTTPAPKPQNNVYYKNCSEVRAAGKAPIYRGQPGYAKHLDRDGDGIACE